MSPAKIGLRTILLGRARSVLAILLVAAGVCVLDLLAGHLASERMEREYQAVIGARLGHLAIVRSGGAGAASFDAAEAQRVRALAEALPGVALVMPQASVAGIAAAGSRSVLFEGEGIGDAAAVPALPGKLRPSVARGIAVSSAQARALDLQVGSSVMLQAVAPNAFKAEVVDIFSTAGLAGGARPVLMPIGLAQALQGQARVEQLVLFLNEPARIEAQRRALLEALRAQGIRADVRSWRERSSLEAAAHSKAELAFDSVAGMVLAGVAAAIAATLSMNALERRRELGTLRAMGMGTGGVFMTLASEALWLAAFGIVLGLVTGGLVAWVVNRAGTSVVAQYALSRAPMLVELDFARTLMVIVMVLAVALLAALVPAFKAARVGIAEALR